MKLEMRNSLSRKLLRVVLLSALAVGLVLSCAQIIFGAYKTRQLIEADAQRILRMTRDPSTQAIYSLDREMGAQVMEGLFQHESIRMASIGHPDEGMLALKIRPPIDLPTRWLTDPILHRDRQFSIPLIGKPPYNEYYGELRITLDTAQYGQEFVNDSIVIFIVGILRALTLGFVLFLIYQWLLTRPLTKLIEHLARINPDRPGEHKLPMIRGHESNELGLWVETANGLLASIEHNMHLRQEAESSLYRMTQYDSLTGLPNRQQLQSQLDHILDEARRMQRRVAVLCLGLDDFKGVNEQYSYQAGDCLLKALADRLRGSAGRLGALARLGGDQFVLVLSGIEQPYDAAELAQALLDDLETPIEFDGDPIRLRATIGITLYPEDGDNTEKLLQKAEQTMTLAKSRSRNRYQFYVASIDSEMRARRELEKDLSEALKRNEFHLVYQPQVDYRQNRITGVEALIRWKHPQGKLVPPDLFIPLAEQNGSIIEIGKWVLDQACSQLRQWHAEGYTGLRVAVNLSTVQLRHPQLPQMIGELLQKHQLPAETLELEVTETGLMEDIDAAAHNLHSLRRSGALIAIDDFGTGYSSLSYLKSLPLDKIKIDKSFVQDIGQDEGATIVRAVIQLGKSLGMTVIAEGVETPEQEAYLIAEGCQEGQGYYYSKPLPARDLDLLLRQSTPFDRAVNSELR
ncbi:MULTISPECIES: putative bifunctional diguanylate cyclase/phosphodiesterase [Stutzerimonas stutzeri subgroup]|uniref:EAL domain-containing protein n=1 Tax=Stutzerimonas chloritidismutans TaxID=203192 RepID=A0ACC5VNT8_STUCH|nr:MULTISPECIES: bifunctional diguanylate cyclase/phosphodiesterase [Stutzerimonas stutzeri subgroup]MBX7274051.1 EAL domain-containing protein [Stutzerimonas chloritidismutans]MCQ2036471.1 EAL domain-containing protein [Stutzerimonas kunmingensis]MCQ2047664.1 EAL domain-containing protein [Stutzerimonas kunmingensis]PKR27896.1 GGDEF-domain containing protein [Stutzerimonas stutzeri]QQC10670.1 EAL domain-containing protein [Stutzerimonas stutzeri]